MPSRMQGGLQPLLQQVHRQAGPSLQPWRHGDGTRGGFGEGSAVVPMWSASVRAPWQQVIPRQMEMLERGATE